VPQLPGMGGAPSGSTGSVTGSGGMGLQPGAQISGSSPARPAAPPAPPPNGAAGVSFQPGQMLMNPFNSGPPGVSTLSASNPNLAALFAPPPARPTPPPVTSLSREDIWKGLVEAKQPPGTKYTAPLVTPKTGLETIKRLGGVSTLTGANFGR